MTLTLIASTEFYLRRLWLALFFIGWNKFMGALLVLLLHCLLLYTLFFGLKAISILRKIFRKLFIGHFCCFQYGKEQRRKIGGGYWLRGCFSALLWGLNLTYFLPRW